jgi:hypothetical protein
MRGHLFIDRITARPRIKHEKKNFSGRFILRHLREQVECFFLTFLTFNTWIYRHEKVFFLNFLTLFGT